MDRQRQAFTIWELLVVVVIVLFLAFLLLPAVNSQSGGRRSICINNLRQLSLALYQYESSHGCYPGYVNPQAVMTSPAGEMASRPIGWAFSIMPGLERSDISDNYGSSNGANGQPGPYARPDQVLKVLRCPSDPKGASETPATWSSYVVNTGLKDAEPDVAMPTGVPRDWAANGIFHFNYPYRWANDYDVPLRKSGDLPTQETIETVTSKYISNHDGTGTTLMLAENWDSGRWTDVLEQQVGFYWQATVLNGKLAPAPSAPDEWLELPLLLVNENAGARTDAMPRQEQNPYGRPSSAHPGGVNVAYADTHASSLANEIDYLAYCQIMTPAGEDAGPAGPKGWRNGQRILFRDQQDGRESVKLPLSEDEL